MMDGTEMHAAAKPLTAIKIDPDPCLVELIQLEAGEVAEVLGSTLTGTMDFEDGQCLVIDDGLAVAAHPARFHFDDDVLQRPYFGPVLILGLENGNWASTTVDVESIRARIVCQHWDRRHERYGEPSLDQVLVDQ